jgi:hypothetical protein
MRRQLIRSAWTKKRRDHAHARPMLCHASAPFSDGTALVWRGRLHSGQGEQLLRSVTLATRALLLFQANYAQ